MTPARRPSLLGTALAFIGGGAVVWFSGPGLGLGAPERVRSEAVGEAGRPRAPAPPTVTVVAAARREMVDAAVVTGTLVAREEVLVAAEVEGLRVAEVLADEGDQVAKGQVLARLDRSTLDAQAAQNDAALARAEAAIAQARSQIAQVEAARVQAAASLARVRALRAGGNSTEEVLEQRLATSQAAEAQAGAAREALALAQADRAANRAQRRELDLRIARAEVRAPAAGVVSRRSARLGAIATGAGEPLFRLVAGGAIELDAEVPEARLARLREGARAEVTLPGGARVAATARLVSPEVDRATRLGRARLTLADSAHARVGASARATLEVERREALAVPLGAVGRAEGEPSLLVVEGAPGAERVVQRRPRLGLVAGAHVEVLEGLAEGERVVARAGGFLRDGDRVGVAAATVAEAAPPATALPSSAPAGNAATGSAATGEARP